MKYLFILVLSFSFASCDILKQTTQPVTSTELQSKAPSVGPVGPQGVQGLQGPQGEKGERGDVGQTGLQGPKGDKGDRGEQGLQGIQGLQGPAGRDGVISGTGGSVNSSYAINLVSEGILSTSNAPDINSFNLKTFLESKPQGYSGTLYIPYGNYQFSEGIRISARPIHLFGDNGSVWGDGTRFYFPKESMGLIIVRDGTGMQETIIENIALIGKGNTKEWMDGVVIRGRVTMRGVYVKGFYNGIEAFANMEEGNDASGSYIEKCFASENTSDGFWLGRVDGNAMTVIGCDARDNGRYGFNDDSFLGNNFLSCMAHYNKGGDYFVRDWANARSTFVGCYSEGNGDIHSSFGPHTTVIGGIWGAGYTIAGGPLKRGSYIEP